LSDVSRLFARGAAPAADFRVTDRLPVDGLAANPLPVDRLGLDRLLFKPPLLSRRSFVSFMDLDITRAKAPAAEILVPFDPAAIKKLERWYQSQGWQVFDFQRATWQAWSEEKSGLVHSPTGSGKTLSAWMGPLLQAIGDTEEPRGIKVLWITPLRALAIDTTVNLVNAATALGCDWRIESRTGDTPNSQRQKQRSDPPDALVTTPESLSVLLSYAKNERFFAGIHTIVVDEWHELMGSKRGVQLDLCMTRLKTYNRQNNTSKLRIWGLSATIGNLQESLHALLGDDVDKGLIIAGDLERKAEVSTVLPSSMATFPWSGHLGITLLEQAISVIEEAPSTLFFTNTRSQAELWFESLTRARPDWLGTLALHHGSIDRKLRQVIEQHLRDGKLRCVVCTSSLDLGVDFSPVEQVVQVGSPKGIARLMQRAGRSGHRPGQASRVICIPTNAFELVEFAAARRALEKGKIENRTPLTASLDVLAQHLVTVALGSGFERDSMLKEVRRGYAYRELSDEAFSWVMDFIIRGGQALKGYPQFNRVVEFNNLCRVPQGRIARQHRMSIGTISGDTTMQVKWLSGGRLGHIEESFIARINPGSTFLFSGKLVELIQVKDMTAFVKRSKKKRGAVPRWQGGRFPMSSELAAAVLDTFALWQKKQLKTPELDAIDHLLKLQTAWSILPTQEDLLVETIKMRDGFSIFFFPFAGRLVNEGLGILVAWRLSRLQPATLTISSTDYGFELLGSEKIDLTEALIRELLSTENLLQDLLLSLNTSEAAKRQFRDIARIAGLVFQGYPGSGKSTRQIQASSGLIFDVLKNHDADNLLLEQANREVLEAQMEFQRMHASLTSLSQKRIVINNIDRLTPLAFPLWADRLQGATVSSESWRARVEKMLATLDTAARKTLDNKAS